MRAARRYRLPLRVLPLWRLPALSLWPGHMAAQPPRWPAVGQRRMSGPRAAAMLLAAVRCTPGLVSSAASAGPNGTSRRSTNAVGPEWFLPSRGGNPRQRPKIVMDEFIRCFTPKTVIGACRDYRAGATINFEMDQADKDKQITTPLLVLWGTRGTPPSDEYPTVWRKFARNLVTIEPLATGHYIQEEMPEQCLDRFFKFFVA